MDGVDLDDITEQPETGPDWQDTWNRNVSRIDDKLIELYKDASDRAGDLAEVARVKIQHMLDETDMDEQTRGTWDKAKADGKLLGAKIERRGEQLIADGRITWARLKRHAADV